MFLWYEKCYYYLEAWKLKHYERVLLYADKILAITNTDALYFTQKYPFVSTYCLPCFFDNISVETVTDVSPENEKYILYHGNLSVLENVRVINYILDNLLPKLDINMRVVIAGKNPDKHLREKISRIPNVSLVANPLQEEMNSLIVFAHIHLLLTFQNTGIKLKLIYSLMKGHGHCLVNSMMIPDPGFEEVCTIADGQEAQVIALRKLYHTPLMPEALQWRQQALTKMGYNNQVTFNSPLINVCTIRSAVRPSQRSGNVVCFHSPCINVSSTAANATGSSFTNSLVPTRQVSGCSA